MSALENNFTRKLFGINIARAFFWCLSQHFVFLLNYNLITHLSLWAPLQVLEVVYNNVTSVKFLLAIISILLVVGIFTLINYPSYGQSHKFNSRLQYYLNYFSVAKLITLLQYVLSGLILAFAYASFGSNEYEHLFVSCSDSLRNQFCVNEKKVFFLILGGWTGLILFFRDNVLHNKVIIFPIIHEHTIFKIKKSMVQTFLLNVKSGFLTLLSFTVMYYCIQKHIVHFIQSYLFLSVEVAQLNNFVGLGQMLSLIIYSTYIIASHELSKLVFHIFFTQHVEFPIANLDTVRLKDALKMSSVPFVQHLAFYDLLILSERDRNRRSILFSLSLPGGHPHHWKAVSSSVITTVNCFSEELDKLLTDVGSPSKRKEIRSEVRLLPTGLQIPITSPVRRNIEFSESFASPKSPSMRNLSMIYTTQEPEPVSAPLTHSVPKTSLLDACQKSLIEIYSQLLEQFQDPAILNYFLVSNTEYKLISILQNVQLISWSVDSLSLLACASFTEDKYGVVQQDLPTIIITILKVKNSLDKLSRYSALYKVFLFYDKHVRSNLKSTIKRSLYRLALTFGDYIHTLSLPPDAEQQMSHYLNFVES